MKRTMVIAGVHLDRAWTDLGSAFGSALRRWSREALALVVEEAGRRDVDTILVLGDLMDRTTVLPETIEYAATVLGSFSGDVLVAPGSSDWIGGDSPYEFGRWASNTTVWTTAGFESSPVAPTLWGSAWTSATSRPPRVPRAEPADAGRILVRARMCAADLGDLSPADYALTSGEVGADRLLAVPDLVSGPAQPHGWALLIDADHPGVTPERFHVPGRPGSLVDVDVTGLDSNEGFASAMMASCRREGPLLLRLVGELQAPVLLPGFGGPELPPQVVLDVNSLHYAMAAPDAADRSARAEFLRAVSEMPERERERHQTAALGLKALSESAAGD